MSRLSDYRNRMTLSQFADEEIEQLLSHQIASDPALVELASFLTELRDQNTIEPDPNAVERVARRAAAIVRSRPTPIRPVGRLQRPGNRLTALRRISATAVSLLAFVAVSSLGLVANAAIPGDYLYGLDIAMEQVGIGAGSLDERISEAQALANRGQHTGAADHLESSIAAFGHQSTADEISRAMEALDEYGGIVESNGPPDLAPANENAGPDNNNAGGNNETNQNAGPDNNNAGGNIETNQNAGTSDTNAGGKGKGGGS